MHPRVVILLGAPGAGKGTQAARLAKELGLPHVATGDLFRENLAKDTPLGRRAREYMDAGKLVPDDVVVEMLFERVRAPDCAGGYLLDGFPRTIAQADALGAKLASEWNVSVVDIEVPDEDILVRVAGRLVCPKCGRVHHERFAPPAREGTCDACGGPLVRRKDDDPAVFRKRLEVYRRETAPLIDYYRARGLLCRVDGQRTPDEVYVDLKHCLGEAA